MKLHMWCIILSVLLLATRIHALKCRNNDEKSTDEFTEVAIICMYNMSNWDRPNMNRDNNGGFNSNRNYNNQNPNENNNRNNYNQNNQNTHNRDRNQDSMYNINNRNQDSMYNINNRNNNKNNHGDSESSYGFRSWRRQQPTKGHGNDDYSEEEEETHHSDNQRSNQREQSNQDKNNQRKTSNRNSNNNNNNYNNVRNKNKNNNKRNEGNEDLDSLLELSGNSPLEQVEPCLVHCIFREMHMLDEAAMPDKTLVTNVMTKRLHDSQVIDFVEDSIEDCFDLLDTDNKKNPCEFTKNLALCLEEKGRRNCEDWEDQNSSKSNNRNSMNPKRPN